MSPSGTAWSDAIARPGPARPASGPNKASALRRSVRALIVDDDLAGGYTISGYLGEAGFGETALCRNDASAIGHILSVRPDVILLDLAGDAAGFDVLRHLQETTDSGQLADLCVLVLTDADDRRGRIEALHLGASDYLIKPIDPLELIPRIDNALIRKAHRDLLAAYAADLAQEVRTKTAALEESRIRIVYCLARAAEYRDNETGQHVIRVSQYAALIAEQLGLPAEQVDLIKSAAPLHDLGKIGIPDALLLKPDRLDAAEWALMKTHCEIGRGILAPPTESQWRAFRGRSPGRGLRGMLEEPPLLQVATRIAASHHEWWDGNGYPEGLAGEAIPIEARITAVADVFDALGSRRPYKEPFSLGKSLELLEEGRGRQFDPRVLDAFYERIEDVVAIKTRNPDEPTAGRWSI